LLFGDAKIEVGATLMEGARRERGGEKNFACPQTPQFWKTTL